MARGNNLNVKFNGDASGIKRASREAQGAVRAFQKTGSDAVSSLGNVFGLNAGRLKEYGDRIESMRKGFATLAKEGKGAFGSIASSASLASGAIAALGVAAAAAAFKQLNAQAKVYESTLEGIVFLEQQRDYRASYAQALGEISGADGRQWTKIREGAKNVGTVIASTVGQGIINTFAHPIASLKGERGSFFGQSGFTQLLKEAAVANVRANQSAEFAGQIVEAQNRQKINLNEIAKLEADIAKYRMDATDKTNSQAERAEAVRKANEAIAEKYRLQREDAQKIYNLQKEKNALMGTSNKDLLAESDYEAKIYQLNAQESMEKRTLLRLQNQLTGSTKEQRTELEKISGIIDNQIIDNQILDNYVGQLTVSEKHLTDGIFGLDKLGTISGGRAQGALDIDMSGINTANAERLQQWRDERAAIAGVNEELANMIQNLEMDAFSTFGEGIGSLVADLANGENALQNFANLGLEAMGDMAISVGKTAIATGVAVSGIKTALESLNPVQAIAAGTALVALGSLVKTSLSNAARGNYGGGGTVSSASYSRQSAASASASSEMTVRVTGTLEASGSKLVAVLNNEGKRKDVTT